MNEKQYDKIASNEKRQLLEEHILQEIDVNYSSNELYHVLSQEINNYSDQTIDILLKQKDKI